MGMVTVPNDVGTSTAICGAPHPDGLGPCAREPGHGGSHARAHGTAAVDFSFLRWES
jgi:hypothetical protein